MHGGLFLALSGNKLNLVPDKLLTQMSRRFSCAGTKIPILPFHEILKVLKLVKNILSLFIKLTSTMIFFSTITFLYLLFEHFIPRSSIFSG